MASWDHASANLETKKDRQAPVFLVTANRIPRYGVGGVTVVNTPAVSLPALLSIVPLVTVTE